MKKGPPMFWKPKRREYTRLGHQVGGPEQPPDLLRTGGRRGAASAAKGAVSQLFFWWVHPTENPTNKGSEKSRYSEIIYKKEHISHRF